jgi:hypothetical protein
MDDDRRYTACCGLYCKDCIPSRESLFAAARALEEELDAVGFDCYAALKEQKDEAFAGYGRFRDYLSAVASLKCSGPCAGGGGKPVCAIRDCAKGKGYAGCWECAGFETCALLEPFSAYHGDTPRDNLKLIREHGLERWAAHRGPHYRWSKKSS